MVPVPRVASINELNHKLIEDCIKYRCSHNIPGREQSVYDAYKEEKIFLRRIPEFRYDTSNTVTHIVGDYSTVRFEKNNYSVPTKYLRKDVTVKGYANEVLIFYEGSVIATFDRIYGVGKTEYRLEHYIDLIERKPRAVFQAKPVRENITKELLDWGKLLPGGNKEMVKLLRLCVDYGEERILAIKASLPSGVVPTVDMIRSHLHEVPESNVIYMKQEIPVQLPDLKIYDQKCGVS